MLVLALLLCPLVSHAQTTVRLDGTPEVVLDGETGYCVEPENVSGVMEATRRILTTPGLSRSMGVLERLDWHRMAEILEQEYLELYRRKTGR